MRQQRSRLRVAHRPAMHQVMPAKGSRISVQLLGHLCSPCPPLSSLGEFYWPANRIMAIRLDIFTARVALCRPKGSHDKSEDTRSRAPIRGFLTTKAIQILSAGFTICHKALPVSVRKTKQVVIGCTRRSASWGLGRTGSLS